MKSLTPDSVTLATALALLRDRLADGEAATTEDLDNLTDAIARVEDYVNLARDADSAFDRGAAAARIRVLRSAATWAKQRSLHNFGMYLTGIAADWAKRGGA